MKPERLIVMLLGVGLLACGKGPAAAPTPAAPAAPVGVVTAMVEAAVAVEGVASVPGQVAARERATLTSRLAAAVVALPLREGETVRRGAVVARLEAPDLQAQLAAAETQAKLATVDAQRFTRLAATDAATPRELEQAEARAAAASAAVVMAREQLSHTVLRAPFDGVIAARPASVGDVVSPGSPLIEIDGLVGLEVRATVDGAQTNRLAPGTEVRVWVDGWPEALAAKVRSLAPTGDATHRFELRADLPQPAPAAVRAGLFARVEVAGAGEGLGEGASLTIPHSSIFQRGGLTGVFVVAEGRARLRWVAVGAVRGSRVEVRAGLAAGERVVISPAGLTDGVAVADTAGGPR